MEVRFANDSIEQFIRSLQSSTKAKTARVLMLLEKFGYSLGMPHSKNVGHQLFELRVRGIQDVRLFYTFYKGAAVVLHGCVKKTSRIPSKELDIARRYKNLLDTI